MQIHRCESSSFSGFLIATLFLTKNVAPQFGAGVGSDVATCSALFSSVAFLDVGFNGRSHGRSRARRQRCGLCSASSYGLPCLSHSLFEGRNPVGGLVIDVVGDADLHLLVVGEALPEDFKVTTKKRLVNDLKAALNAAWPRLSSDRKKLNPTFLAIVKAGFKAERIDDDDVASVARDNQILTDEEVGAILQAAFEVDQEQGFDGDLYRNVVCLAATGARYAQVRRMRVGDIQVSARRLMVPGSYKGRGGNSGSDPVPVGNDVIEVLLPAIAGRPSDAPLFERWIHEQEPGGIAWKKSERGPWKRGELARPWKAIREHAGMPEVIPYALRHSSIVRGLRKGLPIQQVAKLHNTSVKMIERHYAKYIAIALEDLARAAVVSLVPRSDGNVVPLGKRA